MYGELRQCNSNMYLLSMPFITINNFLCSSSCLRWYSLPCGPPEVFCWLHGGDLPKVSYLNKTIWFLLLNKMHLSKIKHQKCIFTDLFKGLFTPKTITNTKKRCINIAVHVRATTLTAPFTTDFKKR